METMGAMFDFCKIMYGSPDFDLDFYVKLGDAVLTTAGYKAITGKDYVPAATPAVQLVRQLDIADIYSRLRNTQYIEKACESVKN